MCPRYYSRISRPDLPFCKVYAIVTEIVRWTDSLNTPRQRERGEPSVSPPVVALQCGCGVAFQESDPSDMSALGLFRV